MKTMRQALVIIGSTIAYSASVAGLLQFCIGIKDLPTYFSSSVESASISLESSDDTTLTVLSPEIIADRDGIARVLVDDLHFGTTPVTDCPIAPGRHVIRIAKEGMIEERVVANLLPGKRNIIIRTLYPKAMDWAALRLKHLEIEHNRVTFKKGRIILFAALAPLYAIVLLGGMLRKSSWIAWGGFWGLVAFVLSLTLTSGLAAVWGGWSLLIPVLLPIVVGTGAALLDKPVAQRRSM